MVAEYLRENGAKFPYVYFLVKLCFVDAKNDQMIKTDGRSDKLEMSDKLGIFAIGLFETFILLPELIVQIGSSIKRIIRSTNK